MKLKIIGKNLRKKIPGRGVIPKRFNLAILIVAKNEEKTIGDIIDGCSAYGHIMVINDNSVDSTLSVVKKENILYYKFRNNWLWFLNIKGY